MGETVKGSVQSVIDFGSGGVNRCRQYRFDFEDLTSQTFLPTATLGAVGLRVVVCWQTLRGGALKSLMDQ